MLVAPRRFRLWLPRWPQQIICHWSSLQSFPWKFSAGPAHLSSPAVIFPVVAGICQISLTFCGPWSRHHHKSLPLCTQLKASTVSVMLHYVTNQQKKSSPLLFTKPQIPEYMLQSRRPLLVSSLTTSAQTYLDVCYCEIIALSFNGDQLLLLKWFFHLQLFTLICFKTENFQISNETGQNQREIRHDPVYQNTDRSANISFGEDSRDMGEQRWSTVLCVCINWVLLQSFQDITVEKSKCGKRIIVNNSRFPTAFIFHLCSKCSQLFVSTSKVNYSC